jgi:hypothetical protein
MRALFVSFLAILTLLPATASAHKPSDSYLSVDVSGAHIDGQWDIALRDLEHAIGVDSDGDGKITWGELQTRRDDIAAYALSRLRIGTGDSDCAVEPVDYLVDRHSDGVYSILRFAGDCGLASGEIEVGYTLFFDLDPQHRGLLRLTAGGETQTAIFSPADHTRRFELGQADLLLQGLDYLVEGMWHIWVGFDHVLFLLTLLLPAVFLRRTQNWQPIEDFRSAFGQVLKIVTAFTVAHSITLSLAVLGAAELPSRLVESAIAGSVVVAALNNIYPVVTRRLWLVAFAFGLIHGFGFASVLADLGLPQGALAVALFGFNAGVELGQLAIVAVFLPLAFWLRDWRFYPRLGLQLGSGLVAAVASVWLVERALNLTLPVLS